MKKIFANFWRLSASIFQKETHFDINNIPAFIKAKREKALFITFIYIMLQYIYINFFRSHLTQVMIIFGLLSFSIVLIGFFIFLTNRATLSLKIIVYPTIVFNATLLFFLLSKNDFQIRNQLGSLYIFTINSFYIILVSAFFLGKKHTILTGILTFTYLFIGVIFTKNKLIFENMVGPLTILICLVVILVYFNQLFETIVERLISLKNNLQTEIEEKTKNYQLEKEKAEKANAAKNIFLANVSHDLRTPLNSIVGFTELLSENELSEKNKQYLNIIKSSCGDLMAIINDLLDISKIEANKIDLNLTPINIKNFINNIYLYYYEQIKAKNLELIINIQKEIPDILILDIHRTKQVIFNLLNNSIQYTNAGYIKLSIFTKKKDKNLIDLIVSIEDSGKGIPVEEIQKIFTPFETAINKNSIKTGRFGLGLSITKKIIEAMNSKIIIKNKKNRPGSIFTIVFSNIEIIPFENFYENESVKNFVFEKVDCLIVDDIENNRIILRNILEKLGLSVVEVSNPFEIVDTALNIKPKIIFLDLKMPELDGFEVIKLIKAEAKLADIPVIAISAFAITDIFEKTKNYGFAGFIKKPFTIEQITEELKKYISFSTIETTNNSQTIQNTDNRISLKKCDNKTILFLKNKIPKTLKDEYIISFETFSIDRIEKFLKEISIFANDNKINQLENWALKTLQFAENFEIDDLKIALTEFKMLI